jgi:serine/threonine protein kinase
MDFGELSSEELKPYIINLQQYEFIKKLDGSQCGTVSLYRKLDSGELVGIKKLHSPSSSRSKKKFITDFTREVSNLIRIKGKFLLKFYGFATEPKPLIVTEYVSNGNLLNKMQSNKGLTGTQKTINAIGIAYGMKTLHSLNILHRDLKPENVLLDEKLYPIICDFGLSRSYDSSEQLEMTNAVGSPVYMSPFAYHKPNYGHEVDVWSYGATLFHMVAGVHPYSEVGRNQFILFKKLSDFIHPEISEEIKDLGITSLIKQCFATDPAKFLTFNKIFEMFQKDKNYWFPNSDEKTVREFLHSLQPQISSENPFLARDLSPSPKNKINWLTSIVSNNKSSEREKKDYLDNWIIYFSDCESPKTEVETQIQRQFWLHFIPISIVEGKENFIKFTYLISFMFQYSHDPFLVMPIKAIAEKQSNFPKEVLFIFQKVVNSFDQSLRFYQPFLDLYLYLTETNLLKKFIDTLYYLKEVGAYDDKNHWSLICAKSLKLSSDEFLKYVLNAMIQFKWPIASKELLHPMKKKTTFHLVLDYLILVPELDITKDVISRLILGINEYQASQYILCKLAKFSSYAQLILHEKRWIIRSRQFGYLPFVRILSCLCGDPCFFEHAKKHFFDILKCLTESLDQIYNSSHFYLYFHIIVHLFKTPASIIHQVSQNFFTKFIQTTQRQAENEEEESTKYFNHLFRTMNILGRISPFESLVELIPLVSSFLSNPDFISEIASILSVMSVNPIVLQALKQRGVAERYLKMEIPDCLYNHQTFFKTQYEVLSN